MSKRVAVVRLSVNCNGHRHGYTAGILITLLLCITFTPEAQVIMDYNISGIINKVSTGCSACAPVPAGMSLYYILPGGTFTGTLTWDYDPATATSPTPGIVTFPGFSYSIDLNGLTFSGLNNGEFHLQDGMFYHQDEGPTYSLSSGLFMGQPDAFRIFFNSSAYTPADGLPVKLDLAAFDSVTVEVAALTDYSWDIRGTLTT
jgi:hypothetical protein